MVYTATSGSNAVLSGYDGYGTLSSTLSSPGGNGTLNGQAPIHIIGIAGAIAGHGASSTVSMSYAGVATGNFGVGSSGAAVGTGYVGTSIYLSGATSSTFAYNFTGSVYFGRSSSSGGIGVSDGHGAGFTGVLGMAIEYFAGPTPPTSPTVMRATATSATLSWTAPGDSGGTPSTASNIQASTAPDFSTGVVTATAGAGATSVTVTGLTTNASYYFRIAARNEVTDAYGTSSFWSTSVNMPAVYIYPKTWNGSAWVRPQGMMVWNGTQWAIVAQVLVWNGTAWVASV
jgi:hypothetical protein